MVRIIDRNQLEKKKKSFSYCSFCGLIMLVFIVIIGIFSFAQFQNISQFSSSKTKNTVAIDFEVKEGDSIKAITKRLIEQNILDEKYIFIVPASDIYLQMSTIDSSAIHAGTYQIPPQTPINEVYNLFSLKSCDLVTVTFKEGTRIEEFAARMDKALEGKEGKQFDSTDFVRIARNFQGSSEVNLDFTPPTNLEGYLFPNTYNFCVDVTAQKLINRLLQTFNDMAYSLISSDINAKGLDLNEVVIKASMIEREAFNNNDERKVIAGIIDNRLENGMVLGIDATSQYSAGYSQNEGTWWPRGNDFLNQLQRDEPYNTRKRAGLPPTAISNPSLNALIAVVNPIKTNYFYYLHDDCSGIHYAKNLDEHNVNKTRYIGTGRC